MAIEGKMIERQQKVEILAAPILLDLMINISIIMITTIQIKTMEEDTPLKNRNDSSSSGNQRSMSNPIMSMDKKTMFKLCCQIMMMLVMLVVIVALVIFLFPEVLDPTPPQIMRNLVTVVMYISDQGQGQRQSNLNESISSFKSFNTEPLSMFILINDNTHVSSGLIDIVNTHNNITLLTTGTKPDKFAAINLAYSMIQSPYVLNLALDQKMTDQVVGQSINILKRNPGIMQVRFKDGDKASLSSNLLRMNSEKTLEPYFLSPFPQVNSKQNSGRKDTPTNLSKDPNIFFSETGFTKQSSAGQQLSILPIENESNEKDRHEIRIDPSSNLSVVMITCCSRQRWMKRAIQSFVKVNTYPIARFIIVNDNAFFNQGILEVFDSFDNLTLLNTGIRCGQLFAIDMAFSLVKTAYVLLAEDDILTIKDVAGEHISMLDKDPNLLLVRQTGRAFPQEMTFKGYVKKKKGSNLGAGYALSNHIERMSTYHSIPGGSFSALTNYRSYGTGAGYSEDLIKEYFFTTDYEVIQGETAVRHWGSEIRNKRQHHPSFFIPKYVFNEEKYLNKLAKEEQQWLSSQKKSNS